MQKHYPVATKEINIQIYGAHCWVALPPKTYQNLRSLLNVDCRYLAWFSGYETEKNKGKLVKGKLILCGF